MTIIDSMDSIGGAGIDGEISAHLQHILAKQGLNFLLNTKVISATKDEHGKVKVNIQGEHDGKDQQVFL